MYKSLMRQLISLRGASFDYLCEEPVLGYLHGFGRGISAALGIERKNRKVGIHRKAIYSVFGEMMGNRIVNDLEDRSSDPSDEFVNYRDKGFRQGKEYAQAGKTVDGLRRYLSSRLEEEGFHPIEEAE